MNSTIYIHLGNRKSYLCLKTVTVAFFCLFAATIAGQDIKSNLKPLNYSLINPSVIAINEKNSATLQYMYQGLQWKGLQAMLFSIDGSILQSPLKFGLAINQDKLIKSSAFSILGNVAYKIDITGGATFSLGLQVGLSQFTIAKGIENSETDLALKFPDATLIVGGVGACWYLDDVFHVGASIRSLPLLSINGEIHELTPDIHLFGDYIYKPDPTLKIRPVVVLEMVDFDFLWETHLYFNMKKIFLLGAFYKNIGSAGIILGATIAKRYDITYSSSIAPARTLSTVSGAIQELRLSVLF